MSAEQYSILSTSQDEEELFFSDSSQDQACIGHLRGDFGSGTEFWTTWWNHQNELNSQDFNKDLNALVSSLRKDGPLKDLRAMQDFCGKHPQSRMPKSSMGYYGFRVDTACHRYYLRFLPKRGEYNFYIYCYQTDQLEQRTPQTHKEEATNESKIKVLVVEPAKPCEVREISGLKDMQDIVGGHLQAVYPFRDAVALVCNEDGKILGLPCNRPLTNDRGIPYDMICGTFFLAGLGAEDFVSLTEEQIQKFSTLYDNILAISAGKDVSHICRGKKSDKKKGIHHER